MTQTWWTDVPKILEPPQNSMRQKSDTKYGRSILWACAAEQRVFATATWQL